MNETNYEFSKFLKGGIKKTNSDGLTNLSRLSAAIKGDTYKDTTNSLRSALDEEKKAIKCNLDYVTFSGVYKRRSKDGFVNHSNLICIDFDHISVDLKELEEFKNVMTSGDFAPSLLFISPSGDGLKAVYKINVTDENTHESFYLALKHYFLTEMPFELYKSLDEVKDIARACFICRDENAYFNDSIEPLSNAFLDTFCLQNVENDENDCVIASKLTTSTQNDNSNRVTTWDDFNNSNKVFDLISNEFTIVGENSTKTFIKRNGSDANTSGYIWKDNDIAVIFSSSSRYHKASGGHNAFSIYCIQNNYNASEANKQLYKEGYGDRIDNNKETSTKTEDVKNYGLPTTIPIEGFPLAIQDYIKEYTDVTDTHRDYVTGGILMSTALALGNTITIDDLKYKNSPLFFMVSVGEVSNGKSKPLEDCLSFFDKADKNTMDQYEDELKLYNDYFGLTKKEKTQTKEIFKPSLFQYTLNDFTPEYLKYSLSANKRGSLIYRDELAGFFGDFGRYSNGKSSEMETLLSLFSRNTIKSNRVSGDQIHIEKPLVSLCGTVQPKVLIDLGKGKMSDNGLMSRFMVIYPEHQKEKYRNNRALKESSKDSYEAYLNLSASRAVNGVSETLKLSDAAESVYCEWENAKTNEKNALSEITDGYTRGVLGKLSYFALRMLATVCGMNRASSINVGENLVTEEEMRTALGITDYFKGTAFKLRDKMFCEPKKKGIDYEALARRLLAEGKSRREVLGLVPELNQSKIARIDTKLKKNN